MLTLIENGEIYTPQHFGKGAILLSHERILKIGDIKRKAVEALGVECEFIDARGCLVTPGFIDPHQHLLGGSGEEGFSTQTPEINAAEIITAGITTVVGCLGVDTTMKTMPGLLAKVKALKEEGLSAYCWTGGYNVPPTTITKDARDDIMFIEEIIGAGEIALADERSTEPDFHQLAHLVHDTYVGGMLSRKAGVTHFHIGGGPQRLKLLRDLIDKDNVQPDWVYPTHITRSKELMTEAVELAARGSFVDMDTVDEDLPKQLKLYEKLGGDLTKLTVSSDSSITSPSTLFQQIRACLLDEGYTLEKILPLVTANTAQALRFPHKGALEAGKSPEILILEKDTFNLRDVICSGKRLFKDGKIAFKEAFLQDSNRKVNLLGDKRLKKA